jgi:hypothetical protein
VHVMDFQFDSFNDLIHEEEEDQKEKQEKKMGGGGGGGGGNSGHRIANHHNVGIHSPPQTTPTTKVCHHYHRFESIHGAKGGAKLEIGDLHTMDNDVILEGQPFQFALVSQTLEHLYDPLVSLINVYDKLDDGGYFFTSTPCVNRPHMTPIHFRHYTPLGFRVLLLQAGFEIVEEGQWGNLDYLLNLFHLQGMNWPSYVRGEVGSLPIKNDPERPVQVWALVRKPLAQSSSSSSSTLSSGIEHQKQQGEVPELFHNKDKRLDPCRFVDMQRRNKMAIKQRKQQQQQQQ